MCYIFFRRYFVTSYAVYAWRRKVGFGGRVWIPWEEFVFWLCSSCTFCPLSELAGLSHSLLPSNNTYRQSYGAEQVLFVLFIDPTFMYSNTKVFFLGMDVFLISQHEECQAWQGNKGSNFAKWFLWFEAGCTCLDSPAHVEGGIRDAGWFSQFRHALLKQFKSWMIPDPFVFQKLFMYLLFWKVFGRVSVKCERCWQKWETWTTKDRM